MVHVQYLSSGAALQPLITTPGNRKPPTLLTVETKRHETTRDRDGDRDGERRHATGQHDTRRDQPEKTPSLTLLPLDDASIIKEVPDLT